MLSTAIIAFSLSSDAFAASIAKGARFPGMSMWRSTGIALGFGVLEALAPLLGYLLGLRMMWKSFHPDQEETRSVATPTWGAVALIAMGTSVDATAVGVTLALVSDNIPFTLLAIGLVTFGMTYVGLRLGSLLGERTGRWAEFFGGIGLTMIGAHILVTHLTR